MTNTAKHTPGPWATEYDINEHGSDCVIVTKDYNYRICDIYSRSNDGMTVPDDAASANARLIAAAPDLLEALKVCADLLADYDEAEGEEGDAYREALAAIAKAEGK